MRRNVWTPNPSMKRNDRGIVRSDMIQSAMCMLSGQRNEVPEIVMRGLRLRKAAIRLLFGGVDDVGKLDRVLNKENGDIVTHEVPVALLGIELHCKPAHIACQVGRPFTACHGNLTKVGVFSPAR